MRKKSHSSRKKRLFLSLFVMLLFTLLNSTSNGLAQTDDSQFPIAADINLNVKHTVGSVSEFDRAKFINLHAAPTEPDWEGELDKLEYLINDLNVHFGRDTGAITWEMHHVPEDPNKPGYPDVEAMKTRGQTERERYASLTELHPYQKQTDLIIGGQIHPYWPDGTKTQPSDGSEGFAYANGEATAVFVANWFNEYHGDDGQPRPQYYEVINEPLWDLVTTNKTTTPLEVFEFHNEVAEAMRQINPDIQIGGYTTAFPDFEKNDFQRWEERMKLFMDTSGKNMDFYSIHLYDFPNFQNKEQYRKGSHMEATMDMMEHYNVLSSGAVKPFMISEFGSQLHGLYNQPWTPYRDWLILKATNSQMMAFMERPDTIIKTIPFIPLKAEWGRNAPDIPYYWRLMRQANEAPGEVGDEWVFTELIKFYELWSEVQGTRVDTHASDMDILIDAYVDGNTAHVILNSLEFEPKVVQLSLTENAGNQIESVSVKHLYLADDQPVLESIEFDEAPPEFELGAEATAILTYTFADPIEINETSQETKYFATDYYQSISANEPQVFQIDGVTVSDHGEAVLRLGIGRDHGQSLRPTVIVNETAVTVPADFRGYDQKPRERFFGVLEIPVPWELIQEDTTISVEFEDDGGHISSVAMQVFEFSQPIERSELDLGSVSESIQFKNAPTTIPNEDSFAVEVDYVAAEARDVVVELWKDGEMVGAGAASVPAGIGATLVDVQSATPPDAGKGYQWQASLRPVADNSADPIHTVEMSDVTVIASDAFKDIVELINVRMLVDNSDAGSVDVEYFATQSRDIVIEFWDDERWLGGGEATVDAGAGTTTIDIVFWPNPPAPGEGYLWKASIRPVGAKWTESFHLDQVFDVTVTGTAQEERSRTPGSAAERINSEPQASDILILLGIPALLIAGAVAWNVFSNRRKKKKKRNN